MAERVPGVVRIMCGPSGSGKSTFVENMKNKIGMAAGIGVVSADQFFTDRDGNYNFDPRKLSDAHEQCMRRFVDLVSYGCRNIFVDNTNTTNLERAPYYQVAKAFGYKVEFYMLGDYPWLDDQEVVKFTARNVHNVPFKVIEMQMKRFETEIPRYWNADVIVV